MAFFNKPVYLEGILKAEFECHELENENLWDNLYHLSDALEMNVPQEKPKAENFKLLLLLSLCLVQLLSKWGNSSSKCKSKHHLVNEKVYRERQTKGIYFTYLIKSVTCRPDLNGISFVILIHGH